jgi:hypothetical protein
MFDKRLPKGQSKMGNPEKLATMGTQCKTKTNKTKNTAPYMLDTTIQKQNNK